MLLGKRFYDPEAGVFTQRDKAKDGMSYYAYTSGKVMTAMDPWGKFMGEVINPGGFNPFINLPIDHIRETLESNKKRLRDLLQDTKGCKRTDIYCVAKGWRSAQVQVEQYAGLKNIPDGTIWNAIVHCTAACNISRYCGSSLAKNANDNHEYLRWDGWNGPMGLWNNGVGLYVANGNGSCLEGCAAKANSGELAWLRPLPWIPIGYWPRIIW